MINLLVKVKRLIGYVWPGLVMAALISAAALPVSANTRVLYLDPEKRTVQAGQEFTVEIRAFAGSQTVNAVAAVLEFESEQLKVVRIDDTNSAFSISATKTFDERTVKLERGSIGALQGDLLVANVVFQKKTAEPAVIGFGTASYVLRSDNNEPLSGQNVGGRYETQASSQTPPVAPTSPKPRPASPAPSSGGSSSGQSGSPNNSGGDDVPSGAHDPSHMNSGGTASEEPVKSQSETGSGINVAKVAGTIFLAWAGVLLVFSFAWYARRVYLNLRRFRAMKNIPSLDDDPVVIAPTSPKPPEDPNSPTQQPPAAQT